MAIERDPKGKILPGSGGRPAGSRNKFQASFIDALQKNFEKNGEAAIQIVMVERPHEYLKICASIMPKEMFFAGDVLDEMSDDELKDALTKIRKLKAVA